MQSPRSGWLLRSAVQMALPLALAACSAAVPGDAAENENEDENEENGSQATDASPSSRRMDATAHDLRHTPPDAAEPSKGEAGPASKTTSDADTTDTGAADGRAPDAEPSDGGAPEVVPAADAGPVSQRAFDTTVLHEIVIEVDAQYLTSLANDQTKRVPATITFDGVKLPGSGIRKKGRYGSRSTTKPSYSVKLDEFARGQNLDGLDKIILQNAQQDPTFLAEHLIYEVYRMAGLPGPRTAHAFVTLNGKVMGLYVIKEAIDKQFLARNFGKEFRHGNLYEGAPDFVTNPLQIDLKNEKEEMRKRDDIIALASLISKTPADTFEVQVSQKMHLKRGITGFAIDALFSNWDDYWFNNNNFYLYHNPADDKFIFIPSGADWLFSPFGNFPNITTAINAGSAGIDPFHWGKFPGTDFIQGKVAVRLRGIPTLDAFFRAEVKRISRDVWDVAKLRARIDQARTVIQSTRKTDSKTASELAKFKANVDLVRDYVGKRKAYIDTF